MSRYVTFALDLLVKSELSIVIFDPSRSTSYYINNILKIYDYMFARVFHTLLPDKVRSLLLGSQVIMKRASKVNIVKAFQNPFVSKLQAELRFVSCRIIYSFTRDSVNFN